MTKFQVWTHVPSKSGKGPAKFYGCQNFDDLEAALAYIKKGEKMMLEQGYCFEIKRAL